jgi:hypothetical protein
MAMFAVRFGMRPMRGVKDRPPFNAVTSDDCQPVRTEILDMAKPMTVWR